MKNKFYRQPLEFNQTLQKWAEIHVKDICNSNFKDHYNSNCEGLYERLRLVIKDPEYSPGMANEWIMTIQTTSVVEILILLIIGHYKTLLEENFKWIGLLTHKRLFKNHSYVATVCIMINEFIKSKGDQESKKESTEDIQENKGYEPKQLIQTRSEVFSNKNLGTYFQLAEELKSKRFSEYMHFQS